MSIRTLLARSVLSIAAVAAVSTHTPARAQTIRRVDLQVLVVTRGPSDGSGAMIKAALDEHLVPYTELDLSLATRPRIDRNFLVDSTQGVLRARFQAVVLPTNAPEQLFGGEDLVLREYEREFKIRQLDTYVYPSPKVGLVPRTAGSFDGITASVTAAGRAGPFSYLQGPVPFEDLDPSVTESYGYGAAPLTLPAGTTYTSLVEATVPGAPGASSILGVFASEGREEMVFTVAVNNYMLAQKLLFPGILNWLTYGVHLGLSRLWFSVHVDDVFRESGRWSDSLRCTLNESCGGQTGKRILMSAADVDALVAWQDRQGMKLDLAFHAGPHVERVDDATGRELGARLLANRRVLRWINHTYNREFMDCTPDFTGACAIDVQGQVAWITAPQIREAITRNTAFATSSQITLDPTELITGDHTGLRRPGSSAGDNPNLISVLGDLRIAWVGANASAEREQRVLAGEIRTVPRYPTNIFYNVATKVEEAQLYNYVYTSRLDGGGGSCDPSGTCLKRVDLTTGFDTVIAPRETRIALMHVLGNDPRPHYVHQAALSEDRLLYPVADGVLAGVRRYFTSAAPLGNLTMREAGTELKNRASFQRGRARVTGYVQAGVLNLVSTGAEAVSVPVTANLATANAAFAAHWGLRNGWQQVSATATQHALAPSVPYGL
ncbi:MAG: hypothetical protein ABW252_09815 [Polyangiales bacterium]